VPLWLPDKIPYPTIAVHANEICSNPLAGSGVHRGLCACLNASFFFPACLYWLKQMDAPEFLYDADLLAYETLSGGDRPHRVAGSGIVELPFGKGRKFGTCR
jgi:hypothetical protein